MLKTEFEDLPGSVIFAHLDFELGEIKEIGFI
jgi:hypothetical protein